MYGFEGNFRFSQATHGMKYGLNFERDNTPGPIDLPSSISAQTRQQTPRRQIETPRIWTTLYRIRRMSQESAKTVGIVKQSNS